MRNKLSLSLFVFLFCSTAFPQPHNSLETSDSDSLSLPAEVEASDSASMIDSGWIPEEDGFRENLLVDTLRDLESSVEIILIVGL